MKRTDMRTRMCAEAKTLGESIVSELQAFVDRLIFAVGQVQVPHWALQPVSVERYSEVICWLVRE